MGKQEEMDFNKTGGGSKSDSQPLSEFVEKAYLDYSMYVILDRALPFICLLYTSPSPRDQRR